MIFDYRDIDETRLMLYNSTDMKKYPAVSQFIYRDINCICCYFINKVGKHPSLKDEEFTHPQVFSNHMIQLYKELIEPSLPRDELNKTKKFIVSHW